MIKKVEKIVREKYYSPEHWKFHISLVVDYSKKLMKKIDADREIIELGVLLHDVGVEINDSDHAAIGSKKAGEILKELRYSEDVINRVKHCVESHRTGSGPKPNTIEAEIVANADALSHFDMVPVLIYWRSVGGGGGSGNNINFEDVINWIETKLKADWDKKLTLPGTKNMVRKKYDRIKLLLNS